MHAPPIPQRGSRNNMITPSPDALGRSRGGALPADWGEGSRVSWSAVALQHGRPDQACMTWAPGPVGSTYVKETAYAVPLVHTAWLQGEDAGVGSSLALPPRSRQEEAPTVTPVRAKAERLSKG